jgi:hypothetical protein
MNKKIISISMIFSSSLSIVSETCREIYICPKCLGTRIADFYGFILIIEDSGTKVYCSKCKTPARDYLKFYIKNELSHRLNRLFHVKGEEVYV